MRTFLTTAALLTLLAGTTLAQLTQTTVTTTTTTTTQPVVVTETHAVITPQSRRHVWHRAASPVRLDAVNVDLTINEQVATTTLELTVFNPGSAPQQAELLIPVADGASVRSLQYDGTGPEPTAKVLPRDEARRIYDSIVGSMRDPALLEFASYGVLRTSAFPIPANSAQKIRITIEQVLTADNGRIDWVLPRTEMLSGSGTPWTFKATVKNSEGVANVFSASHDLGVERKGPNEFALTGNANTFRAAGSLRISTMKANKDGKEPVFTTAAYPDASVAGGGGQGGFFNLIVSLPSLAPNEKPAVKREVTVVIDRSGSMRGDEIKQAIEAAKNVLSGLNDGELFNIIDFSDQIAAFNTAAVAKDADSLKRGIAYLDAIQPTAGTNIRDALIEAVRSTPTTGALPIVLFLTDGLPTVGERNEVAIREAVKQANSAGRRLFTFGVGFDVNSPLLNALARSSRGSATFVTPDENIEVKVGQMFKHLTGPTLASPKITIIDAATGQPSTAIVRDMQPASADAPDVFDGEQFIVCGQYTGAQKFKVRIDGEYLGKPHTFEYEIDPSKASVQNSWVSRMWASRRIGAMLEILRNDYAEKKIDPRNDPRAKELIDEVVSLSTRFGILTEYTAFLATEPTVALGDNEMHIRFSREMETANGRRGGIDAVKQEGKLADLASSPPPAPSTAPGDAAGAGGGGRTQLGAAAGNNVQYYYNQAKDGRSLEKRELTNVNQIQDRTFFNRNNRWVDGDSITKENDKPDRTVTIGTDDYTKLTDELLVANLGGILALDGDVLLTWKGQRILLQNTPPAPATPAPVPQP